MPNKHNIEKVKELADCFSRAKAIYFTEYHGLDVHNITRLRKLFFEANVDYKVAKNTLIKLAIDTDLIPEDEGVLNGSTAVAISYDEPIAPAKVIKEFKKDNELPNVKGILLEGDFIPGREFKKLADMPSKDELLSQLVAMLNSPLQKLVSTLNAPMQDVIGVLGSLKEKK